MIIDKQIKHNQASHIEEDDIAKLVNNSNQSKISERPLRNKSLIKLKTLKTNKNLKILKQQENVKRVEMLIRRENF